jgi:hypothetical protein
MVSKPRRPAVQYGAIDLHRRSSVICLAGAADGSYEEQTVGTSRAALTAFFAARPPCAGS